LEANPNNVMGKTQWITKVGHVDGRGRLEGWPLGFSSEAVDGRDCGGALIFANYGGFVGVFTLYGVALSITNHVEFYLRIPLLMAYQAYQEKWRQLYASIPL
jgi:hypothetical protein